MKWIVLASALALGGGAAVAQTAPAPTAPMQATPMPADTAAAPATDTADPTGGYQPSAPPLASPPPAGAQVVFQAAPPPNVAFPPPAPMDKYPVCKKGQYDNCMQRGGR